MTLTVQTLQDWLDVHYPDNRDFAAMLCYWANKYLECEGEAKRLNHQLYKDCISQRVIDDE